MQNYTYTKITSFLNIFSLLKLPRTKKKSLNKKIDPIYNDWKNIGIDMRKGILLYDQGIKR